MSPSERHHEQDIVIRPRWRLLALGGLALGAGINLMVGNEDFVVDAAGVLLATGGTVSIIAGLVSPDNPDSGQPH